MHKSLVLAVPVVPWIAGQENGKERANHAKVWEAREDS